MTPQKVDTSLHDTTYISATTDIAQTKMILIEDFTGVRCPNCPTAAQKIENLQTLNPDRILATSIHVKNNFGIPLSGSKYDFRTDAGFAIFNYLPGVHSSLPVGSINRTRHLLNSNQDVLQPYNTWPTYVAEELLKTTCVNINISGVLVDSIYKLNVKLHYTQATSDTQALTVYLIEDNIIDWQTLPSTAIDTAYTHKHILRAVLTNFNGDNLNASLVINRVFEREFKISLNPKWVKSNCSIIAFVHKNGYYMDIIHAQQKPLL